MYGSRWPGWFLAALLFPAIGHYVLADVSYTVAENWNSGPEPSKPLQRDDAVLFSCRFSDDVDRNYWDLSTEEDWGTFDGVRVSYEINGVESFRAVTLYVKSGEGWYVAYLPVVEGRNTTFISFSSFEALDDPDLWNQVSGLRLSPWQGTSEKGTFIFHSLKLECVRILSVLPNESSSLNESELSYAIQLSGFLADQFQGLGFPVLQLPDQKAAIRELDLFDLVILPYNSYPSREVLSALKEYLEKGGKLLVCYSASNELAELSGFKLKRYLSSSTNHRWSAMRLEAEGDTDGILVQNGTPNLIPVSGGVDVEVVANWVDTQGRVQKEPAALLSGSTLWFTSVITPEDEVMKQGMLLAVVDRLQPDLNFASKGIRKKWFLVNEASNPLPEEISRALEASNPLLAWKLLENVQSESNQKIADEFPAPLFEMRGIWDAEGNGWNGSHGREEAQILSDAGITDVFVFVPRSSSNPIRAVRAFEGLDMGIHAWHICWKLTDEEPVTKRRFEREGRLQISEEGEITSWLCPSNEKNVKSELRRIQHLADTSGIRGVHLDYLRWEDGFACVCSTCENSFKQFVGYSVPWPETTREGKKYPAFLEWRALQISQFVKKVSSVMSNENPELQLSAAVWPSVKENPDRIGQEWPLWVKKEWVDFVVAMNYTSDTKMLNRWLHEQKEILQGRNLLISGIGYASDGNTLRASDVLQQLSIISKEDGDGFVLFKLNASFNRELAPVLKKIYGVGKK